MWRLFIKTFSKKGEKDGKPVFEELALPVTVFKPEGRVPTNGDKFDIKGTFKMNSNPNYVMVRRDSLPADFDESLIKPSMFPEVTAFEDGMELLSESDPTSRKGGGTGNYQKRAPARKPAAPKATPVAAASEADDDPWAIFGN